MIKINKDHFAPMVKFVAAGHPHRGKKKWVIATNNVVREFSTDPTPFNDGTYKFLADYGGTEFRTRLLACQGPKCCFCEKSVHNGQIEHFRPKQAWQQATGSPITYPGYYWLAYRWENLFISCAECNQKGQKGNLFPVNGVRATNHTLDYNTENSIIINPAVENPTTFISFNLDVPVGIDASGRGQANIDMFKLKDRGDIKQARFDYLELYKTKKLIATLPTPIPSIPQSKITEARKFLRKMVNRKQPFAGMIVENIRKGLI